MTRFAQISWARSQFFAITVAFWLCLNVCAAKAASAFENAADFKCTSKLDELAMAEWKARHLQPAPLCADEVFLRRVYLDLTGTVPDAEQARSFLSNPRGDKRSTLVNTLLKSDNYADYWALKWCDVLRVKSEFPINLWPNAVQAYHRWIHNAIQSNIRYDRFARELLTSSGSNFRTPQVNFYRAVQGREPGDLAQAVALTFMGTRLERWPANQKEQMGFFFSRLAFKETAEWKEEIVFLNPAPVQAVEAVLPDQTKVQIGPARDPRQVFADWLVSPENPWFARAAVNRIWYWLMGRGLVHEPDDIRRDNPPVHPEVLAYLQNELITSGYDLKHIYKLISVLSHYKSNKDNWL
ncbi:MAG: DUF1549 and DUF1553 domain-containing protein [Planctomycetaceae bacterium]|nr:DUF1549 and DUF1553 domain-containing protein [Planctomycetaceae bacterium]